jgi:hypothetical protein
MQSIIETPDFASLNPDLKDGIREAENAIRQVMIDFLAALPAELRPLLASIIDEMPAKFILSQLPLYRHVDDLFRMHQALVADSVPPAGSIQ